jgi:hypothetical protein
MQVKPLYDKKTKTSTKQVRTLRNFNFLPVTICNGFENDLELLISNLCPSFGFKGSYLQSEYKSKYLDSKVVTPADRRSAAIAKWQLIEERNSYTNQRLQLGDVDFSWTTSDKLISTARRFIAQVLGDLNVLELFSKHSGHSNGASTRIKRSPKAAIDKHTGKAHVSSSAYNYWRLYAHKSVLDDQEIELQESSVLFTVPKATEIDRVACKEPEINMFLQRSIGTHISRKLRRVGISLNDQTINQTLASQALQLDLATIDLSSASDSITKQLVYELLPFDWWELLDDLRVHSTVIDGIPVELNMFSSMGNGFTFELESLIFWALTRSIMYLSGVKGKLSVFGDDIIAPRAIAPRLARVFAWFGFKVNTKKSHWTGSFRESCGKHYYQGRDVTPFFLREAVRCKTDVIRLLNKLMEWDSRGFGFISDPLILSFHKRWAKEIPFVLHGGQDPEDPSALVTGSSPRSRLVPITRDIEFDQQAALTCWLTNRETLDYPLSFDVNREVSFRYSPMPVWTVRTAWDPWIMDRTQCGPIAS